MHRYGVREVAKLLRLPRSTIRALIDAGFVSPARGPRRAWQFSFQDLIVLRTAQALADARVPSRRITQSVRELRRRLPESMPLSGLRITAVGDRVVVRERDSRWQADSGQYLLGFEGDPAAGSLSVVEPAASPNRRGGREWLERAIELESEDSEGAAEAYRQAIAADPALLDAHLNLGCLLHESGQLAKAERAYRAGLEACGDDASLHYNIGLLMEDMGRKRDAMQAYLAALGAEPEFADCHYNLALVCEQLGRMKEAIRHLAQYRRLTGSD
jgi:tetratricopeptide (TPR) repeat protein